MRPEGLFYRGGFLTEEEEAALIAEVERLDYQQVVMRGQAARRTVVHFGWDYGYEGFNKLWPTVEPPGWLRALADRCAAVVEVEPASLEQFLVARYPAGATIGWHRDAPMFGSPVVGLSLGSICTMRFRRKEADGFETHAHLLEPRSLYALTGPARTQWQHSIPAVKGLRYSITMRTVKNAEARRARYSTPPP